MTYRSDIDGLRAIAVLAVVFFHFFEPNSFNGFVGVDIFFVISGYLITNIIYRDLSNHEFSISHFYERRARRILPALTTVLIASSLCAYVLFLPDDGIPFSKSLVSTSLFSSNFLFWSEAGYFDSSSLLKPLLHTWSLAIEEQFYILFPLLLWCLKSVSKQKICVILISLCALSFFLNIFFIYHGKQSSAFYMLPMRAWELLIGSILVFLPYKEHAQLKHSTSLGLLFLLLSFFVPVEQENFPGAFAILPTVGTALILYSRNNNQSDYIKKFLSTHPMVFIGKISYSMYLWHWPIYVFASYYWITDIGSIHLLILFVLCFLLSYLSWRFVEQPFRTSHGQKRSIVLALSAVSILFMSLLGYALHNHYTKKTINTNSQIISSFLQKETLNDNDTVTVFGSIGTAEESSIALWGDSHAGALIPAIRDLASKHDYTAMYLSKNNFLVPSHLCPTIEHKKDCYKKTDRQLNYLSSHKEIKTVIIAHRWSAWVRGWQKKLSNPETALEMRYNSLLHIANTLNDAGKDVVIFMQVPEIKSIPINMDIKTISQRIEWTGRHISLHPKLDEYFMDIQDMKPIMSKIEKYSKATVIWPHEHLCNNTNCRYEYDDRILYKDDDHLSPEGAAFVAPLLERALKLDAN